jgi:hypothetical protein
MKLGTCDAPVWGWAQCLDEYHFVREFALWMLL